VATPLTEALSDPPTVAANLATSGQVYGVISAVGRRTTLGGAIFELNLRPLPALEEQGYPTERVRIAISPDGDAHAYVLDGRDRQFLHRNPAPTRDLCLQYEKDSDALRWLPGDGFEPLISLVHRHLMFEEAWRRHGEWPCEDAPHGDQPGHAWPVTTAAMRQEQARWAR
jgi:hypothetical protein